MKGLKKLKLPNKYGSVYKLSGKRRKPWTVRKTVGWKLIGEKQKAYPIYEFIGYYATKSEALQSLAEYNANPYDLKNNNITFAEVYEKWSNIHFEKVSHSNVNGYKASYKLCDSIKNMKFVEIKLDHLQKIVDTSGKNVPILKKLKVMLGLVYEYAVIHEIVLPDKREMIRYLDISKAGNPNAYNRKPFTDNEIQVLWDNKDSNIYITVILILIYTGCRISELLNLKKKIFILRKDGFISNMPKQNQVSEKFLLQKKLFHFLNIGFQEIVILLSVHLKMNIFYTEIIMTLIGHLL